MFVKELRFSNIYFKHAQGMRDVYGKEFHIFHELFFFLGDAARFTSEQLIEDLQPNSLVIIPKQQFHQFDCIGEEERYHRYVIQFDAFDEVEDADGTVFDRVKLIPHVHPHTRMLFDKLCSLIDDNKSERDKASLTKALLTEIVMDLKYGYTDTTVTEHMTNDTIKRILAYIDTNYLKNITVSSIAEALNFSQSHLSHLFKKSMHISIYQYVLKKKLMHAYRLIGNGTPAVDAAAICGFHEYSGFYRLYKKYVGITPTETKHQKNGL